MKYYFIVNPGSRTGQGEDLWKQLAEKLDESKVDYEVLFTKEAGDATRLATTICKDHPENKRVVICGGDGTINQAVNGLTDYETLTLGIVPTGSGNDLARGLGISEDTFTALETVIHPKRFKEVDHGIVEFIDEEEDENEPLDSRKFAVSSGIGYDAEVCYEVEFSKLKKFLNAIHLGGIVYYLMGIKQIFTNKRKKAVIIVDGKQEIKTDKLLFAAAMNTAYEGGGMPMVPDADPSDGKISLCIVHDVSRLGHLGLMPTILNATHVKHKKVVKVVTGKTIDIICDRPTALHTDGEYAGLHKHVRFSCTPKQIRMMC